MTLGASVTRDYPRQHSLCNRNEESCFNDLQRPEFLLRLPNQAKITTQLWHSPRIPFGMGLPHVSFCQEQHEPDMNSSPQIVTSDDDCQHSRFTDLAETVDFSAYDKGNRRSLHSTQFPGLESPLTSLVRRKMSPPNTRKDGNNRKRRSTNAGEQVKHRRTRSGCLTCRGRRVKVSTSISWSSDLRNHATYTSQCDESHPMCQRKQPIYSIIFKG